MKMEEMGAKHKLKILQKKKMGWQGAAQKRSERHNCHTTVNLAAEANCNSCENGIVQLR